MTAKDFALIADILCQTLGGFNCPERQLKKRLVNYFCMILSRESPRFNEARFRRACGEEVSDR